MSTAVSRYADYGSACPRCQQIINTIDITFQQGIFIYDLTFIQQELESVLISAIQRQYQLLQQNENNNNDNNEDLILPLSSMIRLSDGKKPRDFKAERERRRKAFNGHMSRKRRMKKNSKKKNFFQTIKRERNSNGLELFKKNSLITKNPSESSRPIRSYRPINFTYPYFYETNHRNSTNHHLSSTNKFHINHISYPEQFWRKILTNQNEYLKQIDYNFLEKLLDIDQLLLKNFHDEKEYQQYNDIIHSNEYLLSNGKYLHPELEYSIVLKHNTHLYNFVENISNNNQQKTNSLSNNYRLKRKYSNTSNQQNSIPIDDNLLEFFRRDNTIFSSKYTELQHRLAESISLERLALNRAENQCKLDNIQIELNEIDDKILEITNSIRQRKRPSENAVSLCKPISPSNNNSYHHHQNGNNESEAWRKGRRQSTLRVYDELARLIDERMNLEKQIADINPSIQV